jgi:hypothetical protein
MKFAVGVLAAPRPIETVGKTVASLIAAGFEQPVCFFEPGHYSTQVENKITRPTRIGNLLPGLTPSPDGRFGNFQNCLQSLADLISMQPNADAFIIVEDDALLCRQVAGFLEKSLWPSCDCGMVSLYHPALRSYSEGEGVYRKVVRDGVVGALAMVFHPSVARMILSNTRMVSEFKGSKYQQHGVDPWVRNACDFWVGNSIRQAGYSVWSIQPSLVTHHCPVERVDLGNSTFGVGGGRHFGPRQAKGFIGELADARELLPKV